MDIFIVLSMLAIWMKTNDVFASDENLLIASSSGISIYNTNNKSITFVEKHPLRFVYDYELHTLFFIRENTKIISKNLLTKSEKVIVKVENGAIAFIAVDWISKNLYYLHQDRYLIFVCSYTGQHKYALVTRNLRNTIELIVSPQTGFIFRIDYSEPASIERIDLDGNNRVTLAGDLVLPEAMTVDAKLSKIYWFDSENLSVEEMKLDGTNRRKIYMGDKFSNVDSMGVLNSNLYFGDYIAYEFFSCPKSNDESEEVSDGLLNEEACKTLLQEDVFMMQPYYQSFKNSPCHHNNGGCSHLCLTNPNNYTCACPTGFRLINPYQCATDIKDKIFLVTRLNLQVISLDVKRTVAVKLPISDITMAWSLDFDSIDNMIYWTEESDDNFRTIKRANLDGSSVETVIPTGFTDPDQIAVDWIGRHIYWTCPHQYKIFAARLDGTYRITIIKKNLHKPRGIAVDPIRGKLYFSDWGNHSKIESSDLDGSNRRILLEKDLGWPNDLALDYKRNHLYWVDSKNSLIEFLDLNDMKTYKIESKYQTSLIFSIDIYNDNIFWMDFQMKKIYSLHIMTRKYSEVSSYIANVMDIASPKNFTAPKENICSTKKHGCSHFCFFKSNFNIECRCPDGYKLKSNGKDCETASGYLLYSTRTFIKALSLDNTSQTTIPSIVGNEISLIESDASTGMVIWVESATNGAGTWSIKSSFLNDSSSTKIIQIVGYYDPVFGLAVDWVGKNIYWSRSFRGVIEMSRIDGSFRRLLIERPHQISLLAIHPLQGYLFWFEYDDRDFSRIMMSQLNGANIRILRNTSDEVTGFTVDVKSNKLYWSSKHSRTIGSILPNGMNYSVIKNDLGGLVGLVNFKEYLYFCELESAYSTFGVIYSMEKESGKKKKILQSSRENVWYRDLNVMHAHLQRGENGCTKLNGGCEHLCVATSEKQHKCLCEAHYELSKDDHGTCTRPETFILVGGVMAIYRFSMNINEPENTIHFRSAVHVNGIEYNMRTETIYWLDRNHIKYLFDGEIKKLNLGSDSKPASFVIDFYTNTIFWTNSNQHTIEFMRLDKPKIRGVIFRNKKYRPNKLVIYPEKGLLFFTSEFLSQTYPGIDSIESIRFDGTNVRRIHEFPLTSRLSSNRGRYDVTLHIDSERIYWLRKNEGVIESTSIFNSETVRVEMEFNTAHHEPVAIATHGKYLYWVDVRKTKNIENLKRRLISLNEREISSFRGGFEKTSNILVVDYNRLKGHHPCHTNNGGCSHICYAFKNKHGQLSRQCACPVGYNFTKPKSNTCFKTEKCTNVCEEHCPLDVYCWEIDKCRKKYPDVDCLCRQGEFRCSNQSCIGPHQICDSKPDCPNAEDENPTECAYLFGNNTRTLPITRPTPRVYVGPYPESKDDFSKYTAGIVAGLILTVIVILCSLYGICRAHYKKANKLKEQGKPSQNTTDDVYQMVPIQQPGVPISRQTQSEVKPSQNGSIAPLNSSINSMPGIHTRYLTGSSNVADSVILPFNPPPSVCSGLQPCVADDTGTVLTVNTIYEPLKEVPAPPATPLYSPSESETVSLNRSYLKHDKSSTFCGHAQCVQCHRKTDFPGSLHGRRSMPKYYASSETSYATVDYRRRKSRQLSCSSEETLFGKSISRQVSYVSDLNKKHHENQFQYHAPVPSIASHHAPLPSIASQNSLSKYSVQSKDYSDYITQRDFYNTYAPPPSPGTEFSHRNGRRRYSSKDENYDGNISQCMSENSLMLPVGLSENTLAIPAGIRDFSEYHKEYGDDSESENDLEVERLLQETPNVHSVNNLLTSVNNSGGFNPVIKM